MQKLINFSGVTARCLFFFFFFAMLCAQAQMCQSGRRVFSSLSTKTGTGPSLVCVHNLQPPPPPIPALSSTFPRCCQISESPGQVLSFQNNSNAECHCSGAHKWWKPSSFSHFFLFFSRAVHFNDVARWTTSGRQLVSSANRRQQTVAIKKCMSL